ncbi:MAG: ORF6N domain-containing protein [Bacteroidetes bacterium]|nr:ORF6N domain-containing protein [Bacteroidota bacterium]
MSEIEIVVTSKIHNIRGKQVMLDSDLAELYSVEVKFLNRAVKRNIERFPEDFMFQLNNEESLRFHFGTLNKGRGQHRKYLPFAFTEQGVAMLSSVLRSNKAVEVNILIMRAFVEMRRFLSQNFEVFEKFQTIDKKLLVYDQNFTKIFKAMEQKRLTPKQGIFFEDKVFDAFIFVSDLIKKANNTIILVDNYADENTLTLFSDKRKSISVKLYTKNLTEKLLLAADKFNKQYHGLEVFRFEKSHDRFLIIDDDLYHFGASLKDLGKKWFAFSKLTLKTDVITSELPQ